MPGPAQLSEESHQIDGVFVAASGLGPDRGLYRFLNLGGRWTGQLLAAVEGLAALAKHPYLEVVYGVSGAEAGQVHAWDVSGPGARPLSELPTGGIEPCHVAVSPDARILAVANYESGSLAIWKLGTEGSLVGPAQIVQLTGSSSVPGRQEAAHPHHVSFVDGLAYVVDLGADLVRVFTVSTSDSPESFLTPLREVATPTGTGPRHLVTLPSGDVAVSGELASTVLIARLDTRETVWQESPSTCRTQLPGQSHNYPGDIQRSANGRNVYVANRGYDTISTFAVDEGQVHLVGESDPLVSWPQHLMVTTNHLLVAGRESSLVVSLRLSDGIAGEPSALFECPGAAWLLPIAGVGHRQ